MLKMIRYIQGITLRNVPNVFIIMWQIFEIYNARISKPVGHGISNLSCNKTAGKLYVILPSTSNSWIKGSVFSPS